MDRNVLALLNIKLLLIQQIFQPRFGHSNWSFHFSMKFTDHLKE